METGNRMMSYLRSIGQTLKTLAAVVICWTAAYSTALAQASEEKGSKEKWVLAYFLVIMGLSLGMLVVCRSSRRKDRARPERYAESRIGDESDK